MTVQKDDNNKWTRFAEGEVILKQGFVMKRRGLFARKRMLLLATGPRLIYIDPVQMVKKGEIPMSRDLRCEAKNFKIFFVHTVSFRCPSSIMIMNELTWHSSKSFAFHSTAKPHILSWRSRRLCSWMVSSNRGRASKSLWKSIVTRELNRMFYAYRNINMKNIYVRNKNRDRFEKENKNINRKTKKKNR